MMLAALGYIVFSEPETGLAVAVRSDCKPQGQLLRTVKTYTGALQKKWAVVAIFAEVKLDAPHGWPIKTLVLGSARLHNEEANKSQKTHEHLQHLLDVADDLN